MVTLKKIMGIAIISILIIAIALTIWFVVLGKRSQSGNAAGLINNKLTACPDKRNCVCSEYPEPKRFYVDPFPYLDKYSMEFLKQIVEKMGGVIQKQQGNYIAATFSSRLFGFVDDLELRIDKENQIIHIRSASRVGDSDLGINRKRVERLRALLQQAH